MTNDEVNDARKKYSISILKQKELNDLKEQLNHLENHFIVRKYLKLKDQIEELNKYSSNVMYDFNVVANKTETSNNILVYMGQIKFDFENEQYTDTDGDYLLYWDLETLQKHYCSKDYACKLEDKYTIMYVPRDINETGFNPYVKGFFELRRQFLESLLTSEKSQEEVVKEFIKRK